MSATHPLRAYRKKHALTMSALANAAKTTRQTIHRIEHGQQKPSVDLMGRLALATNKEVPADVILAACFALV
jgi:DNA-binding XRE family transcriptional regulator